MIKAIRLGNLRGIKDSGRIEFRRINIIVGRNSAGKSTLLRVLPLLRQSVEQRTKGPILWYGRLVDFGSFQNAAKRSSSGQIRFEFDVTVQLDRLTSRGSLPLFGVKGRKQTSRLETKVELCLGDGAADDVGRYQRITLKIGGDSAVLDFSGGRVSGVTINGELVKLQADQSWYSFEGRLIPSLYVLREEKIYDSDGEEDSNVSFEDAPFEDWFDEPLAMLGLDSLSDERAVGAIASIPYAASEDYFRSLKSVVDLPQSAVETLASQGPDGPVPTALRVAALLNSLHGILQAADTSISNFAFGVRYIEPLRATAERYYRLQDLAVDEIDSRGGNVAMFLNSLQFSEKLELGRWMRKHFGFEVQVSPGVGHVEVKIAPEKGDPTNIADLGFGYSQILPIALQLWRALVSRGRTSVTPGLVPIIAVEQPELHLHPQYQALLADVLAAAINENRHGEGMVFAETHSEHLVNRLGELVSEKVISPNDVQVIVIDRNEAGETCVKCVDYSAAGFLGQDWPVGFFVPRSKNALMD